MKEIAAAAGAHTLTHRLASNCLQPNVPMLLQIPDTASFFTTVHEVAGWQLPLAYSLVTSTGSCLS